MEEKEKAEEAGAAAPEGAGQSAASGEGAAGAPAAGEKPSGDGVPARAPGTFKSILGIKRGMTQVYTDEGRLCAVTEVEAGPCTVLGVRTREKDGYQAVRLGLGSAAEKRLTKPVAGQFKAAGVAPAAHVREFRVSDVTGFAVGQVVDIDGRFSPLDYVDVRGISRGLGFQGVMKRHGFRGMPGSHGASDKERSPGSLTSRRSLGRVLPGQRMAGHMGHVAVTVQKIEVVKADPKSNRLYLNGSVPGHAGSLVAISETSKQRKRRVVRKVELVLRDKMGNIIKGKGAKARALAEKKEKSAGGEKK